jgi:2-polyprenyl-3-methyl-5-hydroxy-6-metoxy-1,4-benzoquinol methylase
MVEEAGKTLAEHGIDDVIVEVGDLTSLRFDDETFDKAYASEVLEHVPDYRRAVSELARVVTPGGTVVVTTPNRHGLYGFDRYVVLEGILRRELHHPHDEWKTHEELVSALDAAGLDIVRSAGVCYMPGFLVPYGLPGPLKRVLVRAVSRVEPWLSGTLPRRGYMVAVQAVKR